MNEERRTFLDLCIFGLLAEIRNIESCFEDLTPEDKAELQMAMARLNTIVSQRKAA